MTHFTIRGRKLLKIRVPGIDIPAYKRHLVPGRK